MDFTEALLMAIRQSGMSLPVIAEQTGVSTPQLSRFVRGERTLRLDSADRVLRGLGLKLKLVRVRTGKADDHA